MTDIPTILDTLTDWTEQYIRNKDLLAKMVVSMTKNEGGWTISVIRKDGNQQYLVMPVLNATEFLAKMKPDINAFLVVLNNRKNIDVVAAHWQQLIAFQKLCIIFANPNANGDKRWSIFPHTHDKITERKTLRLGLESLSTNVEQIE